MTPMALGTMKKLNRSLFSPHKRKARRPAPPARTLPRLEALEDRVLLDSNPVDVASLEFRLQSKTAEWDTVENGVYSSHNPVLIGFKPSGSQFQSLLAVDSGIKIDTNDAKFTITNGTQASPNWLLYLPGGQNLDTYAQLFGFRADYDINVAALTGTTPLTIGGTSVIAPSDESLELKVTNLGGGSTLVPSSILLAHSQDSSHTAEAQLTGVMAVNAFGKLAGQLVKNLHVSLGDGATYVVTADTGDNVNLVSRTGSGVWLSVDTSELNNATNVIGDNIQVHWNTLQFNWDQTKKTFAFAGDWSVSLKDDDTTNTTPFLVQLGDQTHPGLALNFSQGAGHLTVDHFQAAFIPGTKDGQARTHFSPAGMSVGLDGLFLMYDGPTDAIGIGGAASMSFGPKQGSPGEFENTVQLKLGDPTQNQAGLFIKDGRVQSFDGEFTGTFSIGGFGLNGDVHVKYVGPTQTAPSYASLSGSLKVSFDSFSAIVTLPGQGLVYKNGDWDLTGGINIGLNGGFSIRGFGFAFDNLQVGYSEPKHPQGGVDQVWTFSGGVKLNTLWSVEVTLNDGTNPGLRIVNGHWDLQGIQLHVSNVNFGVFAINNLLVNYEKTNGGQDYQIKALGTFTIAAMLQVGFTLDFIDGRPDTLGVDFKAVGEDPGLPVGDTGLFISEIGFQVAHMDNPQQLEVEGTLGVTYGDRLSFLGHTVTPFVATGSFKVDRNELVLSGNFAVMAALSQGSGGQENIDFAEASGSGSIDLNWGKHQYMASFDIKGFDGVLELKGQFNLNQFYQVTAYVSASVHVPDGVPFIGGTTLAQVDGLFYWDPVDPSKSVVAAWIDIDLIFWHPRVGLEFQFFPPPGSNHIHLIDGGDVSNLEQQATSHPDGYRATFHPTIGGPDNQPNQALFTFAWNNTNEVGDVTITLPDQQQVLLPKGSTDPVHFTSGAVAYAVQAVKELAGARQYGWVIAPDLTVDSNAAYDPIPTGEYTIDVVTAEPPSPNGQPPAPQAQAPNTKLTYTLKYTPPQITRVTLAQPPSSNSVSVQVGYKTALPQSSTFDLYYTTDPSGGSGVKFASVPLAGKQNAGTVNYGWDLTKSMLTWGQNYHVFARINDGRDSNDTQRTGAGQESAISATSVTPYSDLLVQLNINPAVPTDRSADTLAGWTVSWQPLDASGKPSGKPVVSYTNAFGQAGLSEGLGQSYQVTVTPYDRDGFTPLPGAGQTATPDGRLVITRATGSGTGTPATVTAKFQNMVSIHGWISQDLSGNGSYELGGAGVSGELVYLDLNNSGVLAPGDPTVRTDLGGYYEFRTPLPTVTTSYTVRLAPDPRFHMTSVRADPDSTTDFSFTSGNSYTATVNPETVTGAPAFNARDFLLTGNPFVVSGVAYVSGANGAAYQPGDAPVPNQKIWIKSQDGSFVQSTQTAADGSYSFTVPGIGQYQIYTDDQDPQQVNVPGQAQFLHDGPERFIIPARTPDGRQLHAVVTRNTFLTDAPHVQPLSANGDFIGDGKTSFATLGVPDQQGYGGESLWTEAYLIIYHAADSPDAIQATSVGPVTGRFDLGTDFARLPNVFWEPGNSQHLILLATPDLADGNLATWYNPVTGSLGHTPAPTVVPGMTRLVAIGSAGNSYLFLMRSDSGNAWCLLSYADMTDTSEVPIVVASFNFGDFSGIRPVPEMNATPTQYDHLASRWGSLTTGDFDGDGRSDFAFTAVDSQGRQVIGYLLSREGYSQVHSIQLGGWVRSDPSNAQFWTNSVLAANLGGAADSGGLSSLLIHRVYSLPNGSLHADILQLSPNPAPAGPLAAGRAATWFSYSSLYPVSATFGTDQLVDLNGDGLPDLFLPLPAGNFWGGNEGYSVLINGGGGRFQPETVNVYGLGVSIPNFGLITASSQTTRGGLSLPSIILSDSDNSDDITFPMPVLAVNASSFVNSYLTLVNSPGSYGGYNFGFVSGGAAGGTVVSGTAFIDANGNGVQDPGEVNLANQQVTISNPTVPGAPSLTTTTDAKGHWAAVGAGPGGSGVPVGFSSVIGAVDYADSFTLGSGARANVAPNQFPLPAAALALEVTAAGHPMSWSPGLWSISDDAHVLTDPVSPYAGGSGAGSAGGFTQTGLADPGKALDFGIEYGLRDDYVVQFDAVQTADRIDITSSSARNTGGPAPDSLSIYFRPDGSTYGAGVELFNGTHGDAVLDGPDGNTGSPIKTGTSVGRWNNFAVRFDQADNTLDISINQVLLKHLDLTKFASGRYQSYSNAAVNVGGRSGEDDLNPADRFWSDNFQVGAPGSSLGSLVVTAGGLSPRNTAPSASPGAPASPPAPSAAPGGGVGVAVGQSTLINRPDYADSFTLGAGTRANLQPNEYPSGTALDLEVTPAGHPMSWSPLWSISDDANVQSDAQSPYPGGSGAGSSRGFIQAIGFDPSKPLGLCIEYGLRDDYVVQFDAIQTIGWVGIGSGPHRDAFGQPGSLAVLFHADNTPAPFDGLSLWDGSVETPVLDGPDGNSGNWVKTGTRVGQWNNYAVRFDQADNTLTIYVNQVALVTLDLTRFAGGRYNAYFNAAVNVGALSGDLSLNPADRFWADNFQVGPPTTGQPSVRGVAVGASTLIKSLDYADSFAFGKGARADVAPNQYPVPDSALAVEYHAPGTPAQSWPSGAWSLTNDAYALDGALTYPGNSGAGSANGFTQTGSDTQFGLDYGLRDDYVVQIDAVQTVGYVGIGSGLTPAPIDQAGSLAVLFHPDHTPTSTTGVTLYNGSKETQVLDGADGNSGNPLLTGTAIGQWNNYAVEFDRIAGTLSIYVNQKLLKRLDLSRFAGGLYKTYSNAGVSVGSNHTDRTWMDNFQVGAPYVGYQANVTPTTGYDFGVFYSSAAFGAIQGAVFHDDDGSKTWKPTDRPYAGITVYLDLNGDGKLDPNDPKTVTDSGGGYRFNSLRPGNYVVRQILPPNVQQVFTSQPASGTDVQAGQTTYAINFGNHQTALGQDFNLDTLPDYLRLVPTAEGVQVELDLMASSTIIGRTQVVGTFNLHDGRPIGVGDFNGDGHPDLLFQDPTTNTVYYWALHNGQLTGRVDLLTPPPDLRVQAVTDFTRQGTADLVVRDVRTGELQAWFLDGRGGKTVVSLGTPGPNWVVEGVADVNGEGNPDLVLHDYRTGDVAAWLLSGATVIGQKDLGAIDPAYHLVGTEPWSPVSPAGTYIYWQHENTNAIVRLDIDYQQGIVQPVADYNLGQPAGLGSYLDVRPANDLSPEYQYVRALYRTLLGRRPETAGLLDWAQQLQGGTARQQVAQRIWESAEHRSREVDQFYTTYLHRPADASGRTLWVNALVGGMSEEKAAESFLSSAEYLQAHAGTTAYLFGLYADVLGRGPDPAGFDTWQAAARSGLSPVQIAGGFLRSAEADAQRVDRFYRDYLGRAEEPGEGHAWLGILQSGLLTTAQVAVAFLACDEFFARAGTGVLDPTP
jgi:hypothetical protein